MERKVSDFIVERLAEWGVQRIFGLPGDGIGGIMGALDRASGKIEFIQVRHEEMAAFMACGHAKFTGEVGVCLATSGPGAIHLLNGLYDAKLDHQPVVAIVGQQSQSALGGSYQQEVNLASLFADVAHEYVHMVTTPAQMRHVLDRAMRIARSERTVCCVIVPSDVQDAAYQGPPHEHGTLHSGVACSIPRVLPRTEDLQRAANILNAGSRVAILVGAGALGATREIVEIADLLGAGIAKALLGKAAVPDDLPAVTGTIGILGTRPSVEMMTSCDTLLMVGSGFPYAEFLPEEGQARGIQIDIDATMMGMRYPMEVNLVGDSAATLRLLMPLLQHKQDRAWRARIEASVAKWWRTVEARAMESASPLNPQRVVWELSRRLPDHCILTGDSGTSTFWYARTVKLRTGMMASLSGGLATMGSAVPYAIAAKFAHPDRPVVALAGDGAMQMNGMSELITAARYWRKWRDPRLIVLVLNNRDFNLVTWEQRASAGDPKFDAAQDLPDIPYAEYAKLIGLRGIRVDRPDALARAWDDALQADRPVLLEAYTDPDVPPLPPEVTWKQAQSYFSALAKGDSEAAGVMRETIKQLFA
ncbi:thiamine pyrophosphate-requiring protein [Nitrosovibrio sp. Nv17]|uniref:thiamine pyrophosphate-requiring protein n=1 Tax=Nitrosovibrio sp. Nv17 TaxID=1855339 RepID=UPI000908D14E|nr:thiamine pyrophosphate-requiring protein [Nitrosovibrio sp. Nv17]SFW21258.1 pyruvate dehydrogenase (quinone) [Nitrosovibrio sp. Nv17]